MSATPTASVRYERSLTREANTRHAEALDHVVSADHWNDQLHVDFEDDSPTRNGDKHTRGMGWPGASPVARFGRRLQA